MAWAEPQNSKKAVNRAAKVLVDPATEDDEWELALSIVNNWRASHSFPLNTFQTNLRKMGRRIDPGCTVAQRIKRLPSILHKIERYPTMTLSQMQDIGGCRAIMSDVAAVRAVVNAYSESRIKHKLHHIDDYISTPKPSGYRGIHLVYRYFSDRKDTYNSLLIELQIRSSLQHAWATAVETVGTFVGQALKSSLGGEDWLRFFYLAGQAIAEIEGASESVLSKEEYEEFIALCFRLEVIARLSHYRSALNIIGNEQSKDEHFFIVELNPAASNVKITSFKASQSKFATDVYTSLESRREKEPGYDVVLVSADSVEALRRAYPNYFADTEIFEQIIIGIIDNWTFK